MLNGKNIVLEGRNQIDLGHVDGHSLSQRGLSIEGHSSLTNSWNKFVIRYVDNMLSRFEGCGKRLQKFSRTVVRGARLSTSIILVVFRETVGWGRDTELE